ncbi:MAG: helix-turn-helix transcriptional regulator [Nitrososphaeria archaeon]
MNKLRILFIVLVSASVGLGMIILILAATIEKAPDLGELFLQLLTGKAPSDIPFFVPLSFLLFFLTTLASSVGVVYFLIMPEIQTKDIISDKSEDILSFLLPDEKKIVDILIKHDGEYLQKFISKEAGFTRVKTHRVVVRLAQRGIVSLEKRGNTNIIRLNIKNTKAKK